MVLLVVALILVKHVRLSRWRWTLGRLIGAPDGAASPRNADTQAKARAAAASMIRAGWRLPVPTKCLARAVALQWRLCLSGTSSLLVIAFHRTDRSGDDAFHAWVERGGDILIGQCDRSAYRPIMVFAQGVPAVANGASSAR